MTDLAPCPLWGGGRALPCDGADLAERENVRAGGRYRVTGTAFAILKSRRTPELAAKLTTWILDQKRSGNDVPTIDSEILKRVELAQRLTIGAQINRFFQMLQYLKARAHYYIRVSGLVDQEFHDGKANLSAWLECEDQKELDGLVTLLIQSGFVGTYSDRIMLSPLGVQRLSEIQNSGQVTDQAFIAMWFHSSLDGIYRDGIEPAIRSAGYSPMRIDKKEHANKIDDEIIAEIRRSRFIVADFTCELVTGGRAPRAIARGGVYFEAGLAQGLGIPVIWCCRSDLIDHVHFDTRQFSHIVWTDAVDLKIKLYNRIRAVLGEAPGAPGLT